MPRVTVLMPTYNVASWVDEAIQSVLNQTYKDFDLLVVDDASSDDTLAHVKAINDPRIRIAAFPNNVGLAENLNRGLDLIESELVHQHCPDYRPSCYELQDHFNVRLASWSCCSSMFATCVALYVDSSE